MNHNFSPDMHNHEGKMCFLSLVYSFCLWTWNTKVPLWPQLCCSRVTNAQALQLIRLEWKLIAF